MKANQKVYQTVLSPGQALEHRMAIGQTLYLRSTFHLPIHVSYWVEGDLVVDFHSPTWWDRLKHFFRALVCS